MTDYNQKKKIQIIGLGLDFRDIPGSYQQILQNADVLAGGSRLLEQFEHLQAEWLRIGSPVRESLDQIKQAWEQGKNVLVLADGDPLYFGIGQSLLQDPGAEHLQIHPNITTLQAAAARLKIPWSGIQSVSLHGRCDPHPLFAILSKQRLAGIFTSPDFTPAQVAELLMHKDRNNFLLHILERLHTPEERILSLSPEAAQDLQFFEPNFLVVERLSAPEIEPGIGLADDNYLQEKGMITKREIRIQGLCELNIQSGNTIWDLGAGSGAVSIEASWLSGDGRVYAVEKDPQRISRIRQSIAATCSYCVYPVLAEMPNSLQELPDPDRIFIGGGAGSDQSILQISCRRIKSGGRIVMHFVLLESLTNTIGFCRKNRLDYRVSQVQISRSSGLQGDIRFSPLNPMYILTIQA